MYGSFAESYGGDLFSCEEMPAITPAPGAPESPRLHRADVGGRRGVGKSCDERVPWPRPDSFQVAGGNNHFCQISKASWCATEPFENEQR